MKKTIETVYAERNDITFIMEHIEADTGEPIQTAVIGWYHGEPNGENTRQYIGDLIATYERKNVMRYKLIMSDTVTDKRIEKVIEAKSVFDAIDLVAEELDHPEETELIEAIPDTNI